MDLATLNILNWGQDRLGQTLVRARHELYQHVFGEAYKAGIAEALETQSG